MNGRRAFVIMNKTRSNEQLTRFLVSTLVVSFLLNWIWEMAQMSAFKEMTSRSWSETAALCARATIADVGVFVWIYAIGALATRNARWGLRPRWNVYATVALLGVMHAFWIERAAIASGRWTYSDKMPVVPLLNVGLWPLLQLMVLTPLALWVSNRFSVAIRNHETPPPGSP